MDIGQGSSTKRISSCKENSKEAEDQPSREKGQMVAGLMIKR
jgi:hypothetical protein